MPKASSSQYFEIELVIIDLTSPISVATWNSNPYTLVIIEVSCHYLVEQLLEDKDKVKVIVQDVISMLEYQSGLKFWYLHSNNSSEFINAIIDQFCCYNNIIYEITNLYVLEQNGIAEWAIAIFFEMVHRMPYSAGVNLRY